MTTTPLETWRLSARIMWSSELNADSVLPLTSGILFKSHRCCLVCRNRKWWVYDLNMRAEARGIFCPHKTTPLVDQIEPAGGGVQLGECANCGTVVAR